MSVEQRREWIRAEVDRIVAQQDPEALLWHGAPADEYGPEVASLTELVCSGRADAESVLAVWERWFGPGSVMVRRPASLGRLAQALGELLDQAAAGR